MDSVQKPVLLWGTVVSGLAWSQEATQGSLEERPLHQASEHWGPLPEHSEWTGVAGHLVIQDWGGHKKSGSTMAKAD